LPQLPRLSRSSLLQVVCHCHSTAAEEGNGPSDADDCCVDAYRSTSEQRIVAMKAADVVLTIQTKASSHPSRWACVPARRFESDPADGLQSRCSAAAITAAAADSADLSACSTQLVLPACGRHFTLFHNDQQESEESQGGSSHGKIAGFPSYRVTVLCCSACLPRLPEKPPIQ